MMINAHSKVVDESTVQLKELSTSDTATVFLSMAQACLDRERLSQGEISVIAMSRNCLLTWHHLWIFVLSSAESVARGSSQTPGDHSTERKSAPTISCCARTANNQAR
jgi:hypothetical protein